MAQFSPACLAMITFEEYLSAVSACSSEPSERAREILNAFDPKTELGPSAKLMAHDMTNQNILGFGLQRVGL